MASARDNSDWDVWASKVDLRLQCGMPCSKLEVSTVQHGTLSGTGYLHQSRPEEGGLQDERRDDQAETMQPDRGHGSPARLRGGSKIARARRPSKGTSSWRRALASR